MLKALISTMSSQGDRKGDFNWVPEGELVARQRLVCDSEQADGGGCGCGRAFAGMVTPRATTTAIVAEVDMTETEWRAQLFANLRDTGWTDLMPAPDVAEMIDQVAWFDLAEIQSLPIGLVVGRRAYNRPDGSMHDELLPRVRA